MSGWNKNTINLLINWSQQININEREHRMRGTTYKRIAQLLNGFGLVSQTGALTTLIAVVSSSIGDFTVPRPVILYVTVVETISFITGALTTFFDFGGLSERHFTAAKNYKSLSLFIHATIPLDRKDRGNAKNFLTSVRKQFNNIAEESPTLPSNKMIHQLDTEIFYQDPDEARGIKTVVTETGSSSESSSSTVPAEIVESVRNSSDGSSPVGTNNRKNSTVCPGTPGKLISTGILLPEKVVPTKYECKFRESLAEASKSIDKLSTVSPPIITGTPTATTTEGGGSTMDLADYIHYQWRRMEED